jgi:urease beta subunit
VTSYTFTNVTSNHTIAASFAINTYTITASAGAGGTISPSGAVVVNYGQNQAFTITANTGYHVADVLVDGGSVGAVTSYTFTNVTSNHTIAASFAINTYTITASAGAGGTISPSGAVVVNYGQNQAFTITVNTGYHVVDVLVDGLSVGAVTSYAFNNVSSNHTIAASFSVNIIQFVTSTDTVTVPEGSTASFQVRLSAQPSADVSVTVARVAGDTDITVQSGASLTFTSANWNVNQAVTLAAAEDVDIVNGTATIRLSASGVPNKDVTATEVDNDTLQFVTSTDTVNVPEGATASFQVRLSAQPSADVSVTVARVAGDTDITVQSGASLTFTSANWNANQAVTLAAADDVDILNGTATIRLSATGVPDKDVTATEQDNDTLTFVTSTDTVTVPEGSTASFQVRLSAQPPANVSVTVARVAGDTDITVQTGGSLTFTSANWNVNQAVTLAAAEDVDIANGTATIRLSATGVPNKDVTATEVDNDTLTFVTSTDTVAVPEGATASFQVRLSAQPSADLSVTVARFSGDTDITVQTGGSLTFTSANWNVNQAVTLAAAEDVDIVNGTATIRLSASGVPNKDVTATEVDNDTLQFVTSTDTVNVSEGATASFQVRLSAQPSADLNVTVARFSGDTDITVQTGGSLTFTSANWNVNQAVTLAAAEDVDIANGTATIRLSASGVPNKDLTATEVDNDTLTFVTSTDTVNVSEGATASFQVRLSAQPSADVSVTVARVAGDTDITVQTGGSLTFTSANWNVNQAVTLAAAEDVDIVNGTATIRLSASGVPNKDLTATEVDNDTLQFVTSTDTVTVPEGSTASFQVRLSAQPSADLSVTVARFSGDTDIAVQTGGSLTFTSANWNVNQAVTLAAAEDVDIVNGTATIRLSATGVSNKDVTATEVDNDTVQFVTSIDAVAVPEGATASFQVRLSAQPSADVSVTVARFSGDTDITVQTGSSLTFTTTDWNTNQAVTLAAAEDVDIVNGTATIRLSATGVPNKDVTATEVDNDTVQFVTSTDTVSVPEGDTASFQVRLSAQPSADVSVTVARFTGDTDITVQSGGSLTFTPADWNTNQGVTLAAAEDVDIVNGTATIRLSATGIPNKDVTATEQDNDTVQFVTSTDTVAVPEGATASFQVRLSAQPSADVSVTVARFSGDTDITVQTGSSLTFTTTDWNTNQTVTLAAAEDMDVSNGTATIRLSATGIPNKDVTATEQDNDAVQFVTSTDAVTVPEGTTASFQVRLSAEPSADVNVTVARVAGDTDITVQSGANLTFTSANWNTNQTVTLAAAEDMDVSNGTATIRLSATGIPNKDVTATEQDDDVNNGAISLPLTPAQGTSGLDVDIPVQISNNSKPLGTFGLDFIFDSGIFTYKSWEPGSLTANWSVTLNATAGKLEIRGIGGTTVPSPSSGSLIKITLQVNCLSFTAPTNSQLRIENYSDDLYDEFLPLPSTANFTFDPCSRLGDVNGDGNVTPGDAQGAFEIYLGKLSASTCQQMTADANCSKSTTPGDAQDIFEHYLGKKTLPQCCTQISAALGEVAPPDSLAVLAKPLAPASRPSRSLGVPQRSLREREPRSRREAGALRPQIFVLDSLGRPGEIVRVPVLASDPKGVRAFGFTVSYPIDLVEFLGTANGALTRDFDYVIGKEEAQGFVRIEGESQDPIEERRLGSLALMIFRVKKGEDLSLPILVLNPERDIVDAETRQGNFLRLNNRGENTRVISLEGFISRDGSIARVVVESSSLFSLKAFGLDISYSKEKMTFLAVRRPGPLGEFVSLEGNEIEPGLVRVGGYRMTEDQKTNPGWLVELIFAVREKGGEVSLRGLTDDIANALVARGNLRID